MIVYKDTPHYFCGPLCAIEYASGLKQEDGEEMVLEMKEVERPSFSGDRSPLRCAECSREL
jgi:hypothetical protein